MFVFAVNELALFVNICTGGYCRAQTIFAVELLEFGQIFFFQFCLNFGAYALHNISL